MATSCSQDDLLSSSKSSENEISFHASMGLKSRATETTIKNLGSFYVSAFKDNTGNYMTNVKYSSNDEGSTWANEGGTYYWPAEGTLNFYAYAPATPGTAGTITLDKDNQKLEDFSPNTTAETQTDFIYSTTTGSYADNKDDGVSLTFKHALSWIDIKAKNGNKAYTVTISDVKIGNIINKGTFTFPKAGETPSSASWTTSSEATDKTAYTTTMTSTTLASNGSVSNQLGGNFMLIPQTLNKQTQASTGTYIAAKVTVTMQGTQEMVSNDWVYVGIGSSDTNNPSSWEMGKHYTYTLDFSKGLGQKEDGTTIFNTNEIAITTTVTPWDEANQYPIIAIVPTSANSLLMSTTNVYAIDIATKPNTFWTKAGGMESAPIADDTEWIAEVIWQDVKGKRLINFCDNSGTAQTTDTYTGTGKTLYVQATGNGVGNIMIGIKPKDKESSYTNYLWSWHLWIAEDPLEIAGFMDRNLGATKGYPTEANRGLDTDETFGLRYQFGRKDPMSMDIHYYKIDGTENTDINDENNSKRNYVAEGPVTIAASVKNPLPFYNTTTGEWVKPNSYTGNYWNDINGINSGTTKTFFDPCPDGWRLPTDDELKVLADNKDYFTWSSKYISTTNSVNEKQEYTYWESLYKTNHFPTPGYLQCKAEKENTYHNKGTSGYFWSVQNTPSGSTSEVSNSHVNLGNGLSYGWNSTDGKSWFTSTNTNRGDAASVRCVRDKNY